MGTTQFMGFVWIEGCVNSSEHYVGTAITGYSPDPVAAQSIGRMDANADNIARLDLSRVYGRQSLIHIARVAAARTYSQ
jgi:hypothetical protein